MSEPTVAGQRADFLKKTEYISIFVVIHYCIYRFFESTTFHFVFPPFYRAATFVLLAIVGSARLLYGLWKEIKTDGVTPRFIVKILLTAVFSVSGLVRRGSSRVFKRKDAEVSAALERIWGPDGVFLTAKDVLSGFSCSRRNAEIRFRLVTGKSVLQELAAARLRRAKKLLVETSLQVSEISEYCGYKFTSHFRKIFHSETGMNPLAWRKAAGATAFRGDKS